MSLEQNILPTSFHNKIFNENCLDTLAKLPDSFIDLTITSPPYDDLRDYKGYSFDFEPIARELYRTIKEGGVIVWVVGDAVINGSESGTSFRQALYFKDIGFNIHDTMIYKKPAPRFPDKIRYGQVFEYMFVFSKGRPKTINLLKDRKNKWAGHTNWSHGGHRLKNGEMFIKEKVKPYAEYGHRFNVWEYANGYGFGTKDKTAYKHPAMFPEKLVEDHIRTWSNEDDIVYDPFLGSGTTAKMTFLNHRYYLGSEISEEYYKIAMERITAAENLSFY